MVLKDTGSDRRRFLGGLFATATILPSSAVLAQGIDPYTGQPLYGGPPTGGAPDLGAYQIDPTADPSRNQSSFRARHWSEFYPSL